MHSDALLKSVHSLACFSASKACLKKSQLPPWLRRVTCYSTGAEEGGGSEGLLLQGSIWFQIFLGIAREKFSPGGHKALVNRSI